MAILPLLTAIALAGPSHLPATADPVVGVDGPRSAPAMLRTSVPLRGERTGRHAGDDRSDLIEDEGGEGGDGGGGGGGGGGDGGGGGGGGDTGGGDTGGDGGWIDDGEDDPPEDPWTWPTSGTTIPLPPTPYKPTMRPGFSAQTAAVMQQWLRMADAIVSGNEALAREISTSVRDRLIDAYQASSNPEEGRVLLEMMEGVGNYRLGGELTYDGFIFVPGGVLAPKDPNHWWYDQSVPARWVVKIVSADGMSEWTLDEAIDTFIAMDNLDYFETGYDWSWNWTGVDSIDLNYDFLFIPDYGWGGGSYGG